MVGVIIQAVIGLDGTTYTRQQLEACWRNGLRIQGYVFPGGLSWKLPMFDGYAIEGLWLDLELPITIAAVNAALQQCDAYIGGTTGIYTGKWFFDQEGWSTKAYWANRPLWDANYDGVPVPAVDFVPYGGWTSCVIKQYRGTSSIGDVHMIDLDTSLPR